MPFARKPNFVVSYGTSASAVGAGVGVGLAVGLAVGRGEGDGVMAGESAGRATADGDDSPVSQAPTITTVIARRTAVGP
ncbi:MAG: hypothetical protein WEF51_02860, partial [Chloroflexota bacterium]